MRVEADVRFSAAPPTPGRGTVEGRISGHGSDLVVSFSRSPSLSGIGVGRAGRMITAVVAQGFAVRLEVPAGTLAVIGGDRPTPWWQLPLTRSRRLRLGPVRVLRSTLGGPRIFAAAWPSSSAPGPSVPARIRRRLPRLSSRTKDDHGSLPH